MITELNIIAELTKVISLDRNNPICDLERHLRCSEDQVRRYLTHPLKTNDIVHLPFIEDQRWFSDRALCQRLISVGLVFFAIKWVRISLSENEENNHHVRPRTRPRPPQAGILMHSFWRLICRCHNRRPSKAMREFKRAPQGLKNTLIKLSSELDKLYKKIFPDYQWSSKRTFTMAKKKSEQLSRRLDSLPESLLHIQDSISGVLGLEGSSAPGPGSAPAFPLADTSLYDGHLNTYGTYSQLPLYYFPEQSSEIYPSSLAYGEVGWSHWLNNIFLLDGQDAQRQEHMIQAMPEPCSASSVPSDALDQVLEAMASPVYATSAESYSQSSPSSTYHFPELSSESSPSSLANAEVARTNNINQLLEAWVSQSSIPQSHTSHDQTHDDQLNGSLLSSQNNNHASGSPKIELGPLSSLAEVYYPPANVHSSTTYSTLSSIEMNDRYWAI